MFQNKSVSIIVLWYIHICTSKDYSNYTLFKALPVTKVHLDFFKTINRYYDVIYWSPPGALNKSVEFLIGPDQRDHLLKQADVNDIGFTVIFPDIQKIFDEQIVRTYIRRNTNSFNWESYYRLNDIYNWLRDLNKAYPSEIQLQSIGRTSEKRHIMAARIALEGSEKRSTVMIEGGSHAREWISPAFVTYMINEILHSPDSKDEVLKKIALTYEWYFIPVLNPDGYEHSHTQDRLWRKNRRDIYGVDINRNFDIDFGGVGTSRQKHSVVYCGEKAFSERESAALAEFVKSKSSHLEYYFTFHNYGQYMILPYAQSSEHLDNYDEVKEMATQAVTQIARRYNTKYTIGTAEETVGYLTSGVSDSWVKKTFRVPYVATFELPDTGYYGFGLPKKILPVCIETMDGMVLLLTPKTDKFSKRDYPYKHFVL